MEKLKIVFFDRNKPFYPHFFVYFDSQTKIRDEQVKNPEIFEKRIGIRGFRIRFSMSWPRYMTIRVTLITRILEIRKLDIY